MVDSVELSNLAQAKQQMEQQQNEIAQRQLEAQRNRELLQRQVEAMNTQQVLRSRDLQGKKVADINMQNINQANLSLSSYEQSLSNAKNELSNYETNVIKPAELQQKQIQEEQAAYNEALNWIRKGREYYGYNNLSSSLARSYAKEMLQNENAIEELNAKVNAVNSQQVTLNKVFTPKQIEFFTKQGLIQTVEVPVISNNIPVPVVNNLVSPDNKTYNLDFLKTENARQISLPYQMRGTAFGSFNQDLGKIEYKAPTTTVEGTKPFNAYTFVTTTPILKGLVEFSKPIVERMNEREQQFKNQNLGKPEGFSLTQKYVDTVTKVTNPFTEQLLKPQSFYLPYQTRGTENKFAEKTVINSSLNNNILFKPNPELVTAGVKALDIFIKGSLFAPYMETAAARKAKTKQETVQEKKAVSGKTEAFDSDNANEAARSLMKKIEKTYVSQGRNNAEKEVEEMAKKVTDETARNNFEKFLKELYNKKIIRSYVYNTETGQVAFLDDLSISDRFNVLKPNNNLYSGLASDGKIANLNPEGRIPESLGTMESGRMPWLAEKVPTIDRLAETETAVKIFTDQKTTQKTVEKNKVKELNLMNNIFKNASSSVIKNPTTTKTSLINLNTSSNASDSIQRLSPSQVQTPLQKQTQIQLQPQVQPQIQSQILKTSNSQTPRQPTRINLLLPSSVTKKLSSKNLTKLSKAYNVLVKRKGKFFNVGKNLPESKAKKLGSKYALTTLARTFKLKESGTTFEPDINFNISGTTFRAPKNKEPLTFVQRQALNKGSGEVPEILSFKRMKQKRFKII